MNTPSIVISRYLNEHSHFKHETAVTLLRELNCAAVDLSNYLSISRISLLCTGLEKMMTPSHEIA